MHLGMVAATHSARLLVWFARWASVLIATLTAGCVATFPGHSTGIITFADTVSDFDVVPPGWITPDGNARDASTVGTDGKALAFVFPSLLLDQKATEVSNFSIPDFLVGDSGFRGGTFHYAPAAEAQSAIEIATVRSRNAIVIDIDDTSMSRILRLPLDRFRRLQAAYTAWLFRHCSYSAHCFSPTAGEALRGFWKNGVLREASFRQFAARNLSPSRPVKVTARHTTMFATRISPRQQLSVTWGNQNFYPDTSDTGAAEAELAWSYSRTTSGGNTRLPLFEDAKGMRLYPALNCSSVDIKREKPDPTPNATLPYPDEPFRKLFPKWFMPIYNLFDLHNPYLLTAPERTNDEPATCSDEVRKAPPNLFLLTPAYYVKPDNWKGIGQFETEGGIGSSVGKEEQFLLLTRQFVILACDKDDQNTVADEWLRMLDAAAGKDRGHGNCGPYLHGVFSAKTFVELRNRFSLDGRSVEDGVLPYTGIGHAVGPSLGARLDGEVGPNSKPLLQLLRALPTAASPNPHRMLLRFYTTMSDVLNQAVVLEGDDIHAISVQEILR